jgi:hypothetical protein
MYLVTGVLGVLLSFASSRGLGAAQFCELGRHPLALLNPHSSDKNGHTSLYLHFNTAIATSRNSREEVPTHPGTCAASTCTLGTRYMY